MYYWKLRAGENFFFIEIEVQVFDLTYINIECVMNEDGVVVMEIKQYCKYRHCNL